MLPLSKNCFVFFRYEMSDKVISACHKLNAHLNDTKVLSNRELVSPHNLRKKKYLQICGKEFYLFLFFPVGAFIGERKSGSSLNTFAACEMGNSLHFKQNLQHYCAMTCTSNFKCFNLCFSVFFCCI